MANETWQDEKAESRRGRAFDYGGQSADEAGGVQWIRGGGGWGGAHTAASPSCQSWLSCVMLI